MIEIVLAHTDLARVRFAHSPAEELVASLRMLQDPGRRHMYGRWTSAVQGRLRGLRLDRLTASAQSWWRLTRLPQVSSKTASMPP